MVDKNILIVEDERIVAEDIKTSLKRLGYNVLAIVSSGKEAITKALELKPDLVLMDILLKGDLDGIEAANKIRSKSNIPVIYLTAHADEITLKRAKLSEPFGYIVKPFETKDLKIAIDMALHKWKMERFLKEDERWFSKTLWSISNAVIATNKNGFLSFMNPAAEKLTGWNLEDATGKYITSVLNIDFEETNNHINNPLNKLLSANSFSKTLCDLIIYEKNGTKHHVESSISPINNDLGTINGMIIVCHDITERKRREKELIENIKNLEKEITQQKSEIAHSEKMASLGYLVAGVAHEINNPLSYVKSNNEFIKDTLSDMREQFYYDDIEVVTIDQIKKLINKNLKGLERIADVSKILQRFSSPYNGGKFPADINMGIENTLLIVEGEFKDRVRIKKRLGSIPKIECNIDQLNQVFMTYILNSLQSMERGELEIKTKSEGDHILIRFKDNAPGVPGNIDLKLPDVGATLRNRTSVTSQNICFRIIEEHNGEINVENGPQRGTITTIKLPI